MARTIIDEKGNLQFLKIYDTYPVTSKDFLYNQLLADKKNNFITTPFLNPTPHVDLNDDPEIRMKMTDYFFDKFKHSWIRTDFIDLHSFLKITKNDNIEFVKSWKEYTENNDIEKSKSEIKAYFITREIFDKGKMVKLLNRFIEKNESANWYDLKRFKEEIKDVVHRKLRSKMKKYVLKLKENSF